MKDCCWLENAITGVRKKKENDLFVWNTFENRKKQ